MCFNHEDAQLFCDKFFVGRYEKPRPFLLTIIIEIFAALLTVKAHEHLNTEADGELDEEKTITYPNNGTNKYKRCLS